MINVKTKNLACNYTLQKISNEACILIHVTRGLLDEINESFNEIQDYLKIK
jgi:hypothetical protein